ncbi:hypothetical protein B0H16DRAFT_1692858 [Mycena metata]|uniref:Uncharacterized protein n=1 Tax=Mycena metata TaxID=1033252 RepID=A0AAD7N589_9AGAR|nr:hypothetical protein B0H16DRAFT_1692858 [Mycena metata]
MVLGSPQAGQMFLANVDCMRHSSESGGMGEYLKRRDLINGTGSSEVGRCRHKLQGAGYSAVLGKCARRGHERPQQYDAKLEGDLECLKKSCRESRLTNKTGNLTAEIFEGRNGAQSRRSREGGRENTEREALWLSAIELRLLEFFGCFPSLLRQQFGCPGEVLARWWLEIKLTWTDNFCGVGVHKGLQFMGDIFLRENDEATAISLFTLALQGFTLMDVHRSRAECMIRLGDISEKNGDLLNALELWEMAKPLFERSSQTKQMQAIDERMSRVDEDVKEQHQKNLARLVELFVPAGKVDEEDEEDSEIELELDDAEVERVVV